MSLNEIIQHPESTWEELKNAVMAQMRVSMPGIVVSFDPDTRTAAIQPAIREKRSGVAEQLPLLVDVPVYFPGGAGISLTFRVSPGDECLVVFSDTCIDGWFQRGGVQSPAVPRRHSLSDGFALVGFRSMSSIAPPIGDDLFGLQVRDKDGWKVPLRIDKDGKLVGIASSGGEDGGPYIPISAIVDDYYAYEDSNKVVSTNGIFQMVNDFSEVLELFYNQTEKSIASEISQLADNIEKDIQSLSDDNVYKRWTDSNGFVLKSTGVLEANADYVTTDFIPVRSTTTYIDIETSPGDGGIRLGVYDSEKTLKWWWVENAAQPGIVAAKYGEDIAFIRISYRKDAVIRSIVTGALSAVDITARNGIYEAKSKIDTADIVQNTESAATDKVPSAAVTHALALSIAGKHGSGGFFNDSIDTNQRHVCDYYRIGDMVTVVYDFYFVGEAQDVILIASGLPKAQDTTIPALTKDGKSEHASVWMNEYGGLYKYYRPMSNGRYNGTFSYICKD